MKYYAEIYLHSDATLSDPAFTASAVEETLLGRLQNVYGVNSSISVQANGIGPTEAIYGFIGWLATRKEKVTLSAKNDTDGIMSLITEFLIANNLPLALEPTWYEGIATPDEKKLIEESRQKLTLLITRNKNILPVELEIVKEDGEVVFKGEGDEPEE